MQNKIWVIGDSHARSFSYNNNFIPIFMGSGKTHCFVDDKCMSNVISKAFSLIDVITAQDLILFCLGEPDTRFYYKELSKVQTGIAGVWTFLQNNPSILVNGRIKIKNSFMRYCQLIDKIKAKTNIRMLVLNILPSNRKDQNRLVNYFNKLLLDFCSNKKCVEFIDINTAIYNSDTEIIKDEYFGDKVHLNMKIQLLVEAWLIERGIIEKSFYDKENKIDNNEIKRNFKFNEQFGCYTL